MTGTARRFSRFSLVGLMGAALQLLLISLLTRWLGFFSTATTPVAVEIAILHNFMWHECYTWRDRGPKGFRQIAALQLLLISLLTRWLGFFSTATTPVAVEIAILHNFMWHERYTWRDRGPKGFRQIAARLWRFHAGNGLVSLIGNTIVMYCLAERLQTPPMIAAIGAILLCSVVNFLIADRWIYANVRLQRVSDPGAGKTSLQ